MFDILDYLQVEIENNENTVDDDPGNVEATMEILLEHAKKIFWVVNLFLLNKFN
jgi:hypothetical protein